MNGQDLWHCWFDSSHAAAENMAFDEALLEWVVRLGRPVLRFYAWNQPAASFGYFQKYDLVQSLTALRPLVRRPTGGGVVPHDRDWTYSIAVPPTHPWFRRRAIESYRHLHRWIQASFQALGLDTCLASEPAKTMPGHCFAGPALDDVLWNNRKIAGAAQRRTVKGLLIQGSIQAPPGLDRKAWQQALLDIATDPEPIQFQPWSPEPECLSRVVELMAEKYASESYNQRR